MPTLSTLCITGKLEWIMNWSLNSANVHFTHPILSLLPTVINMNETVINMNETVINMNETVINMNAIVQLINPILGRVFWWKGKVMKLLSWSLILSWLRKYSISQNHTTLRAMVFLHVLRPYCVFALLNCTYNYNCTIWYWFGNNEIVL